VKLSPKEPKLKRIAVTLASFSLMMGLAAAAQASPPRIAKPLPPVPASTGTPQLSAITSKLAKLHLKLCMRLSARELKTLGLTPVPKRLAVRLPRRASRGDARTASVSPGWTFWHQYQLTPTNVWAQVWWYSVPYVDSAGDAWYTIDTVYWVCDQNSNNCYDTGDYTYEYYIRTFAGFFFYYNPSGSAASDPELGWGPYSGF
jgi:hypothetical protein